MKTQDVQRKDLPSTHKLGETQLLVLEDLQNYRLIKKYQTLAPYWFSFPAGQIAAEKSDQLVKKCQGELFV